MEYAPGPRRRPAQRTASAPVADAAAAPALSRQSRAGRQSDGQPAPVGHRPSLAGNNAGPESWVEIVSQPSSSSLSSIGDEIVTTGLRVGSAPSAAAHPPRRRRLQHANIAATVVPTESDSYDETESDDDRSLVPVPGGSAVAIDSATLASVRAIDTSEEEMDDAADDATAVGRYSPPEFRPEPNAFTHPVHAVQGRPAGAPSVASRPHDAPTSSLSSSTPQPSRLSSSPAHHADNDAALRASLTTLLSCAAAARGLPPRPKHDEPSTAGQSASARAAPAATGAAPAGMPVPGPRDRMEFRLVPESELMGGQDPAGPRNASAALSLLPQQQQQQQQHQQPGGSRRPRPHRLSSPSSSDREANAVAALRRASNEKDRRSAAVTSRSAAQRAAKKKRLDSGAGGVALISPTLLTWVLSAGVVVLISVVGFGAGYVIGREVGRHEGRSAVIASAAVPSPAAHGGSCGRELARSSGGTLRRFRWGSTMGMSRSVAA